MYTKYKTYFIQKSIHYLFNNSIAEARRSKQWPGHILSCCLYYSCKPQQSSERFCPGYEENNKENKMLLISGRASSKVM